MSENENTQNTPDRELIESVWAEARDLIKRLEGSTVQRFAVAAGDYKIEIERGSPPQAAAAPSDAPSAPGLPRWARRHRCGPRPEHRSGRAHGLGRVHGR